MATDKTRAKKPARLGRGLSSLMSTPVQVPADQAPGTRSEPQPQVQSVKPIPVAEIDEPAGDGLVFLALEAVQPNPHQPRQQFDPASLNHLAESIRVDGLMQPVVVCPIDGDAGAYHLVAGERRLRAAAIAGLRAIPAIVRRLNDRQIAEWALIENLQREDLNPIERAQAFAHLIDRFELSHEQIAQRVGLDRSSVTNLLRLLTLDESVRQLVRDGLLSLGQARALASVTAADVQIALARRIVAEGLSVRAVELAVRKAASGGAPGNAAAPDSSATRASERSALLHDLEQQIGQQLQTKVRIRSARKKGSGSITIDFYSLDQFDALMAKLGVETD